VPPGSSLATAKRFIQTQKNEDLPCVAWRPGMCRQAVPSPGTQDSTKSMCRLAALKTRQAVYGKFPET